MREMARAVGLGGRDRRAGSAAERARLNVTRAIKSALQKISEHNELNWANCWIDLSGPDRSVAILPIHEPDNVAILSR